jgi:hypothetical protein
MSMCRSQRPMLCFASMPFANHDSSIAKRLATGACAIHVELSDLADLCQTRHRMCRDVRKQASSWIGWPIELQHDAERPVFSNEVSGVHRLELVPDPREARERLLRAVEAGGRTPPAPALGDIVPSDLGAPELYLNRELTYLNFCWRVMHEAADDRVSAARADEVRRDRQLLY